MVLDHQQYHSPFSWRYGSPEMRHLWAEETRRRLMRRVWVALAAAQHRAGLVSAEQLAELRQQADNVNLERALAIERETRHDVMAEIRAFAEQCPTGGGIIHWGATSADITDNVDVLRVRQATQLLTGRLERLLSALADRIEATASLPAMAFTHIQPAEPTTVGYRLAVYAQDLLHDLADLRRLLGSLKGKGLKGAVGTAAGYVELLRDSGLGAAELEALAMAELDLPYYPIATQTYSRQQDLRVLNVLAGIASSLHKMALDLRLLQSPAFGELAEPFAAGQVGSSAMPFKRNPIQSENICSLARYVAALPAIAWDNASQAVLERSLDDSANRRIFLPEAFLATEEIVNRATAIIEGLALDERAVAHNMAVYGPFAASERVLMALVGAGASRQEAHEWLRQASLVAWEALRQGSAANPLVTLLTRDERIGRYLAADSVRRLMDATAHVGTAPERAAAFVGVIRGGLTSDPA
jgi:adenylosuccinate lyase